MKTADEFEKALREAISPLPMDEKRAHIERLEEATARLADSLQTEDYHLKSAQATGNAAGPSATLTHDDIIGEEEAAQAVENVTSVDDALRGYGPLTRFHPTQEQLRTEILKWGGLPWSPGQKTNLLANQLALRTLMAEIKTLAAGLDYGA